MSEIIHDLAPKNRALLAKRDALQDKIDSWYKAKRATGYSMEEYRAFLTSIGYLLPEGPAFKVTTTNVDPEIAVVAGPQLVVPVMNARYALNAANARWGSLYDALYGTDAISEDGGADKGKGYNPVRGAKVIAWARNFLDESAPLAAGSGRACRRLSIDRRHTLHVTNAAGATRPQRPGAVCRLHWRCCQPDLSTARQKRHACSRSSSTAPTSSARTIAAGISDVVLESALTSIMDCEDSIAAVDAEDKTLVYRNWLGLMKGDLTEEVAKGGKTFIRKLNADTAFTAPDGSALSLKGRALMLVRNVGHLMTNPAILDRDGNEVPEGIMDALVTGLIALHDVGANGRRANSREGSMYVVKPKMHGPEEVAFASRDFRPRRDSSSAWRPTRSRWASWTRSAAPRSTSRNASAPHHRRVVFINTGFLDRTGDEIHTSMEAGPMIRKGDMKAGAVDTGL